MTQHTTAKGYPYPGNDEPLTGGAAAIQRLAQTLDRIGFYAAAVSDPTAGPGDARFGISFPNGWFDTAPAVTVGVEQLGVTSSGMTFRTRLDSVTANGCYVTVSPSNATAAYGIKVNVIAMRRTE